MPGIVDILLKITGDSRQAVQAIDDVGAAAERNTERVGRLRGALTGVVSAVGSIVSSVGGFAFGVEQFGETLNRLTGRPQQEQEAQRRLDMATGPADAADAFVGSTLARLRNRGGLGQGFRVLGDYLTGRDNPFTAVSRDSPELGRAARQAFEDLASRNPQEAADVLANLGGTRLARYAPDFAAILARYNAPRYYTNSGVAAAPTVIVNTGVGDPNRIGDEVARALQRANRNNARQYTTTVSG